MKMDQILTGPRVCIRDYQETDLSFLTGMWFDEENGKYLSDPTREYVDAAYQRALDTLGESKFGYYLLIVSAETGEQVGSCSAFPDGRTWDIGYCIHKSHWRRGYASEALTLLLGWLREQGAEKVTAEAAVQNAASNALLRKFGFTIERRAQFQKYRMDITFDSVIYSKEISDTPEDSLLRGIHAANDYERSLFGAVKERFNIHLDHWYSDLRPDQANNNYFEPTGALTAADIEAALGAQWSRGLNYLMFRLDRPMAPRLMDDFGFVVEMMYVMALVEDRSATWKVNTGIEIRDIQTSDIRSDLLDVSSVPEKYRAAAYRNMQMVLDVAGRHPEYHWLCAYKGSKRVAAVYALVHGGFVEMDDLWVDPEHRHQYIATTLIKHITDHLEGTLYLHANAANSAKEMYEKMGFETVETIYEYYVEWESTRKETQT